MPENNTFDLRSKPAPKGIWFRLNSGPSKGQWNYSANPDYWRNVTLLPGVTIEIREE
jgi:hypothetical protein